MMGNSNNGLLQKQPVFVTENPVFRFEKHHAEVSVFTGLLKHQYFLQSTLLCSLIHITMFFHLHYYVLSSTLLCSFVNISMFLKKD